MPVAEVCLGLALFSYGIVFFVLFFNRSWVARTSKEITATVFSAFGTLFRSKTQSNTRNIEWITLVVDFIMESLLSFVPALPWPEWLTYVSALLGASESFFYIYFWSLSGIYMLAAMAFGLSCVTKWERGLQFFNGIGRSIFLEWALMPVMSAMFSMTACAYPEGEDGGFVVRSIPQGDDADADDTYFASGCEGGAGSGQAHVCIVCFSGAHIGYAFLALAIFAAVYPLALWHSAFKNDDKDRSVEFVYWPSFEVCFTALQVVLVALSAFLADSQPVVYLVALGIVFSAILVTQWWCQPVLGNSHHSRRLNCGRTAAFAGVLWGVPCAGVALAIDDEDDNTAMILYFCGLIPVLVAGWFINNRRWESKSSSELELNCVTCCPTRVNLCMTACLERANADRGGGSGGGGSSSGGVSLGHGSGNTAPGSSGPDFKPCPRSKWMDDAASQVCLRCKDEFTVSNRRHHCRRCGELVCGACSATRVDAGDGEVAMRVCTRCTTAAGRLLGGVVF